MHSTALLASIIASLTTLTLAVPQGGPIQQCTYTATPCAPFNSPTETITVYEQPFTATATQSFDCHGCAEVTVEPKNCFGIGLPIQTTTFVYENAQFTTTVDVCSPTPN